MKKIYKILVDNETIPFEAISIDQDGAPLNQSSSNKMLAYENNPVIVDISTMSNIPSVNSIYDPSMIEFPFTGDSSSVPPTISNHGRFALVVDSAVKLVLAFDPNTEMGSKMNAVFLSNPQFLAPEIIE